MSDTLREPADAEADAPPQPRQDASDRPPIVFCLTASEAYPLLERWFIEATREIVVSFRVFDPGTRLRTERGRAIGTDWFDLLVHTLGRGVPVVFYISDFDPLAAHSLHRGTWRAVRQLVAAREAAGPGAATLEIVPAGHPSRVGLLPRLLFTPQIALEMWKRCRELNAMDDVTRARSLRDMPGLRHYLVTGDEGVRPRLCLPNLMPASHHQKVAVFDRTRVAIGGLDVNERRWDTHDHAVPADETWHDVQTFLEDPGRADAAARHILALQRTTGGLIPPVPAPGLVRTLSRRRRRNLTRLSPRTIVNELSRAHRRKIAASRDLIYVETQFFRDLRMATRLARAARRNGALRLLMVLPAAPEDVAFEAKRSADARLGEFLQARCVRLVRRAFGSRFLAVSPVQPRASDSDARDALWGAPIVYVHAKVSIFDDHAAIVSSANLNGRSLYWDTELGVEVGDGGVGGASDVARLRRRCFEHWLPQDAGDEFYAADTAVDAWRRLAHENVRSAPDRRRGFVLPYDPRPADRFGRDVPVVPNEMV